MAYSRYNRYPRRRYRRRYRPRTTYNKSTAVNLNQVARTAASAWKYGKLAMSLINTETKHHAYTASGDIPVNTWSTHNISDVVQGDTELTRDGGKIRAKSIYIKCNVVRAPANSLVLNQVRCVLVQCLTEQRTGNDVYNPSNGGTLVAPRNLSATTQYKVLWDKLYNFTKGSNEGLVIDKFIKIDQHLSFPVGLSTPERNSYMFMMSSGGVSTGEESTYNLYTRLAFIDN